MLSRLFRSASSVVTARRMAMMSSGAHAAAARDGRQAPAAVRRNALLIIDMQYDFCPPNGSLKVEGATDAIPIINRLRQECKFDLVALTQDWHPLNHVSFYENNKSNPEAKLFSECYIPGVGSQMMWPVHCVQGTSGAEFHRDLHRAPADIVVQKGTQSHIDSYSGFFDNDHKHQTEMASVLKQHGITHTYFVGVASDYCVGYSALDAKAAGFECTLIVDACRGVAPDSTAVMIQKLKELHISVVNSSAVIADFNVNADKSGKSGRLSHECVAL